MCKCGCIDNKDEQWTLCHDKKSFQYYWFFCLKQKHLGTYARQIWTQLSFNNQKTNVLWKQIYSFSHSRSRHPHSHTPLFFSVPFLKNSLQGRPTSLSTLRHPFPPFRYQAPVHLRRGFWIEQNKSQLIPLAAFAITAWQNSFQLRQELIRMASSEKTFLNGNCPYRS